jgi:foldase protein PrsA
VVTPKELKIEIDGILKQFPDKYSFRATLLTEKISFIKWKQNLKKLSLQKKVQSKLFDSQVKIKERELKNYYKNNKSHFKRTQKIKLQQIVLATRADADRIRKSLRKGADFSEYAKKYSISPEGRDEKGILGWVSPGSSDTFEFLFTNSAGYISGIRKSDFGYHIIKILKKRRGKQLSFKESKNEVLGLIKMNKMQAIYASWLEKQTREAKILKNESLLSNIKIETIGNHL